MTVQRFNCLACHARDGEGGLSPQLSEELRRYEKADNSEAITPPTLTGVGHKLRTDPIFGSAHSIAVTAEGLVGAADLRARGAAAAGY